MAVCNIRVCWFNHLVSVATVCSGPRSLETLMFVPFFTHNSMMCNTESSTHQLSNEPKTSKPINDTAPQTKTGFISRFLNQKTLPAIKEKGLNSYKWSFLSSPSGSFHLEIPITWRFTRDSTPGNHFAQQWTKGCEGPGGFFDGISDSICSDSMRVGNRGVEGWFGRF